jgi:hypothetical protein
MRQRLQISRAWPLLVYFGGLGLGFIVIEIVCIQRFVLFLGEPVYTFAVVLAGLLGFAGIGSWIVGRLGGNPRLSLDWIIPSILVVLFVTAAISPWIFSSALGLPLPWRIVIVIAMLAPLDICQAIIAVLDAPLEAVANEVFNVGTTEHNYRVREIAEIAERCSRAAPFRSDLQAPTTGATGCRSRRFGSTFRASGVVGTPGEEPSSFLSCSDELI